MGELQLGTCDICKKNNVELYFKKYYYNIECKCCDNPDGDHSIVVQHCGICTPHAPKKIKVELEPKPIPLLPGSFTIEVDSDKMLYEALYLWLKEGKFKKLASTFSNGVPVWLIIHEDKHPEKAEFNTHYTLKQWYSIVSKQ